jgi:phosphoglycolate phosphatase-like HAD superfamily hydrolase
MHVCLFDIDGTLIKTGGAGKAALEGALTRVFGIAPATEELSYSGRTDRAIIRDLFALHGVPDTAANCQRLTTAYLERLPGCLQLGTGRVLPGIAELLEQLNGRADVLIGLLTGNLRAGARAKLGHFGLFDYFVCGGYGDVHLDRDDVAREALAEVRQRLNGTLVLDRVWVIGDTPLDVRCARAVGARVAAVATGWHSTEELAAHQPDLLMADLSDATELLDRIVARP